MYKDWDIVLDQTRISQRVCLMDKLDNRASNLLAVMPEGIGDLIFGSEEWVATASEEMTKSVEKHARGLSDLGEFTFCEVAHNPPAYLHCENKFSWHAKFSNGSVQVAVGELGAEECDYKMEGDHGIISNFSRILNHGNDPDLWWRPKVD